MNIFTNDDYRKIQTWLKKNAIKDSEFESVESIIPAKDTVVIVHNVNGIPTNFKIKISDLLNSSLNKTIIDSIIANAVIVNDRLEVKTTSIIVDSRYNTSLQDIIDDINERIKRGGSEATVTSVNGQTGDVIIDIPDVSNLATKQELNTKANKSDIPKIPTKVSAFTNDIGYLTKHQDISHLATKNELNNKADKSEIPTVPTDISAFNNDVGYLTETALENYNPTNNFKTVNGNSIIGQGDIHIEGGGAVTSVNGKTGDVVIDIPEVPTNVSAFNNDVGYLTQHQDLSQYAKKSDIPDPYDDTEIKEELANKANTSDIPDVSIFNPTDNFKTINDIAIVGKGNIVIQGGGTGTSDYNQLSNKPSINGTILTGDVKIPIPSLDGYATEQWVENKNYLTEHQDISNLATKDEIPDISGKQDTITDLDAIRSGAAKGATAIQTHQDISGKLDKTEAANTYQIKGNYLTEESDPTVPQYVKNISQTDITLWNNKSDFSGNYNDLSNKPIIPSIEGLLTETKAANTYQPKGNYLTEIPEEYITETELDAKGYLTEHQSLADYAKKSDIPTVPTNVSSFTNDANYTTMTAVENKGYITSSSLNGYLLKTTADTLYQPKGDYVKLSENNTFTNNQTVIKTETTTEDSILKVLSTEVGTSNQWRGRLLAGAKNKTFVLGVYNNIASLGAYNWEDSATATGASWSDFYINPAGGKAVYIGGSKNTENTGVVKIDNSTYKAYYNKGEIRNPTWKEVAVLDDIPNVDSFVPKTSFATINGNVITEGGNIVIQGGTDDNSFIDLNSPDISINIDQLATHPYGYQHYYGGSVYYYDNSTYLTRSSNGKYYFIDVDYSNFINNPTTAKTKFVLYEAEVDRNNNFVKRTWVKNIDVGISQEEYETIQEDIQELKTTLGQIETIIDEI